MVDLLKVARENIEAFNAGDWSRFGDVFTSDVVADEVATGRNTKGVAQSVQNARGWEKPSQT